jgi:hypothetical protein
LDLEERIDRSGPRDERFYTFAQIATVGDFPCELDK